jgi:hypothetical protein
LKAQKKGKDEDTTTKDIEEKPKEEVQTEQVLSEDK